MRILVIGLDGATFDQLMPWIEAGYMPTVECMIQNGAWMPLRSTVPPITAPAWSSFATGLNPGRHGVFSFFRPVESTSRERALNDSRDIQAPRFWTVLNSGGLRTGVVDLPMFVPPEDLDGFMVADVIASGWDKALTHPAGLKKELTLALSNVTRALNRPLLDGVVATEVYLQEMLRSLECKTSLDLHLMQTQDWDVFMTVYPHTDVFQHYFWHVVDSTHPWYDARTASRLMPHIEGFARGLDMMVSRLLDSLDDGVVMLVSDHGFGPVKRIVYVNNLLHSLGYLDVKSERRSIRSSMASFIKKWGTRLDFLGLRRLMGKDLRLKLRDTFRRSLMPDVDWTNTVAYFEMVNDQGIWINRKTRLNPNGLEMSASEYDDLRARLVADIRQTVDPKTGKPLFEAVHQREEVFAGPYVEHAPDVMLQPAYGYMTSSDWLSDIVGDPGRSSVSGYHRPEGVFVIWGPNIQSGRLAEARIEDVAPTLLYLAGVSVPEGLDGRMLNVVTPAYREEHPVDYIDASELSRDIDAITATYSDQDEQAVMERLRSLGYM